MKTQSLLVCFLLLVASAAVAVGSERAAGPTSGGWTPIKNLTDPHVKEVAQFAVREYDSQSKSELELKEIVKGKKQVVSGVMYRLDLEVDGGRSKKYEAVVWEKDEPSQRLTLRSFKPINKKIEFHH